MSLQGYIKFQYRKPMTCKCFLICNTRQIWPWHQVEQNIPLFNSCYMSLKREGSHSILIINFGKNFGINFGINFVYSDWEDKTLSEFGHNRKKTFWSKMVNTLGVSDKLVERLSIWVSTKSQSRHRESNCKILNPRFSLDY